MKRNRRTVAPVWIPLEVSAQKGRKVILTGHALVSLTEKITAPRLDVKGMDRRTIGSLRAIANEQGTLTAAFHRNILDEPVANISGRFLLGLVRRGRHTAIALYQVDVAADATLSGYPGMLGEDF